MSRQSRTSQVVEPVGIRRVARARLRARSREDVRGAPTFDDRAWTRVAVPHHWRSGTGVRRPRRTGAVPPPLRRTHGARRPTRRWFLELDGIFYYGDVWLDGEYLGATEGYFAPHAFEVTQPLRERDEHVLAIEVACPPQRDRDREADDHRRLLAVAGVRPLAESRAASGGRFASRRPARSASTARACCASTRRSSAAASRATSRSTPAAEPREARLHAIVRGPAGDVLLDACASGRRSRPARTSSRGR